MSMIAPQTPSIVKPPTEKPKEKEKADSRATKGFTTFFTSCFRGIEEARKNRSKTGNKPEESKPTAEISSIPPVKSKSGNVRQTTFPPPKKRRFSVRSKSRDEKPNKAGLKDTLVVTQPQPTQQQSGPEKNVVKFSSNIQVESRAENNVSVVQEDSSPDPFEGQYFPFASNEPSEDPQVDGSNLEPCRVGEPDSCSVSSRSSSQYRPIFDQNQQYEREEILRIIDALAHGINNREELRARYEEESARFSVNHEFQLDKLQQNRERLDCLQQNKTELECSLKDSEQLLSENHLQLERERTRFEGDIGLKEDFERQVQERMQAKSQIASEYHDILRTLKDLVDNTTFQWVQRETMMSTESEALQKVRRSVEKELTQLQSELNNNRSSHQALVTQNSQMSNLVEGELVKYAHKQQDVIRYNEKRIKALEGCIRTMQLDREIMYCATGENRARLKDIVENRMKVFLGKTRTYRDLLVAIDDELRILKYRSGSMVRVSQVLARYSQTLSTADISELDQTVMLLRTACDRIQKCVKSKSSQRRDLAEIRGAYVERQRQHMLDSEEEYFLMEAVDVPGVNSDLNLQTSNYDVAPTGQIHVEDGASRTNLGDDKSQPFMADAVSTRFSTAATTDPEKQTSSRDQQLENDVPAPTRIVTKSRYSTENSSTIPPKNTGTAMGNAFRRLSMGIGLT